MSAIAYTDSSEQERDFPELQFNIATLETRSSITLTKGEVLHIYDNLHPIFRIEVTSIDLSNNEALITLDDNERLTPKLGEREILISPHSGGMIYFKVESFSNEPETVQITFFKNDEQ